MIIPGDLSLDNCVFKNAIVLDEEICTGTNDILWEQCLIKGCQIKVEMPLKGKNTIIQDSCLWNTYETI